MGRDDSLQMVVSCGRVGAEGVSDPVKKVSIYYFIFFIRHMGQTDLVG